MFWIPKNLLGNKYKNKRIVSILNLGDMGLIILKLHDVSS